MNSPQLHNPQHYTVSDYATWNDNQRYELLHGRVHAMAPAPTLQHQAISRNLSFEVIHFLKPKAKCQIFYAPIDVYLSDDTVVQPDIIVVCDPAKLASKGCVGAPDLIVEILSPSTSKTDWKAKYQLYEQVGVREYWIVNPDDQLVHVFSLLNSKFQLDGTYTAEDAVKIGIFDDITIDLKNVFAI
jgi:Uma2 family endonuclease